MEILGEDAFAMSQSKTACPRTRAPHGFRDGACWFAAVAASMAIGIGESARADALPAAMATSTSAGARAHAALVPLPAQPEGVPWPVTEWPPGDTSGRDVDRDRLSRALDDAFSEPDPARARRTRAVIVVREGRVVAERYARDIGPETRLLGWSMTKSITSALVGILVGQGALHVSAPADVPSWQTADDPRHAITLDQLLRASSGLSWDESYESGPFRSDVIAMLYRGGRRDMASYAAAKPLAHPPDTAWRYSSGTSLIVSGIVRRALGGDADAVSRFARTALFDRIGMDTAILESDGDGTVVGSSYSWASARDWARFGLLHLRDGVWAGDRILPAGWVDYVRTPTPTSARGEYGAHWWLNAGPAGGGGPSGPTGGGGPPLPAAPRDLFYASGHDGQVVAVVPSRDLIVVRLGITPGDGRYDLDAFVSEVIACFTSH